MVGLDTGYEQFTDEDRVYAGSRFHDVVDALFANPYQKVWGRAGEPALPDEQVTIRTVFGGLLALHRVHVSSAHRSARSIRMPICAGDRTGKGSSACFIRTASV